MDISVDFGSAPGGTVGYQFFDASGLIGSRVTASISNPIVGVYYKAGVTPTSGAIGVYWDDGGTFSAQEIFQTNAQPANVTELLGTAWLTPAVAGTPDVNVKTFTGSAITSGAFASGAIHSTAMATGAIRADVFAADAIDAAALATDAVAEIQSGLATAADLATVDTVVDAILVDTAEIGAAGAGLTAIQLPSNGLANVTAWTVAITGNVTGSISGSVGSVTGNIGGSLTSAERNAIADAMLNRDMSAVSDTNSRSPLMAFRFIRNKWSISGSTMTVTKEDDSTSAWSSTVSTDAGAVPVVGNDPA